MSKENYENDVRREDYMSKHDRGMDSIDRDLREQALLERRNRESERATRVANREFTMHMANLKMLNHHGKQFEELQEKDAEESRSISEIFNGVDLQALRAGIVSDVVAELKKDNK